MTVQGVDRDHGCGQRVRYITGPLVSDVEFSFCTLLASDESYRRLLASAAARGFTAENSEFIALDNRGANRFDGFRALHRAIPECRGRHVVFLHDDVEFTEDGIDALRAALAALDAHDPGWVLAGNAGGASAPKNRRQVVLNVHDPNFHSRVAGPVQVESLDENFIVMRRDRIVPNSFDLSGFHFYGADLCLLAEIMGGRSYVIPFLVRHHSMGRLDTAFHDLQERFRRKYRRYFTGRRYATTVAEIRFGWRGLRDGWGETAETRMAFQRDRLGYRPAAAAGAGGADGTT